jgi:predicted nucleic-acid-binding Zn-ribbon protein
MSMTECPKCHATEIDSGWVLSAGKIAYRSDKLSYPLEGGNVRTYVCLVCGYLESYVAPEYLEKIKAKKGQ